MPIAKSVAIRFMAQVDGNTVGALLGVVDQKLREGVKEFTLLISTPGGSVFHGLAAYNFLRGIPAKIIKNKGKNCAKPGVGWRERDGLAREGERFVGTVGISQSRRERPKGNRIP